VSVDTAPVAALPTKTDQPSRPAASILIAALILAVGLSPRIRFAFLPTRNIDIRLQDGLILIALAYLLLTPRQKLGSRPHWGRIWHPWFDLFLVVSLAVTAIHMTFGEVTLLLPIAFYGRTLEMFVLAMTICALYIRAGQAPVLRALHLAIILNFAWVAYQVLTGTTGTVFGDVGDVIDSYGPKLIGEPSAFGTGAFFAFVAALAIAEYRTKTRSRPFVALLMVGALTGTYLSQSRVNLGIVAAMTLLLISWSQVKRFTNPIVMTMLALGGAAAAIWYGPSLVGRVSFDGVMRGLSDRLNGIWVPLLHVVGDHPIIGIGPGGLVYPLRSEAHNILLRSWLDFGIIGGLLLLGTLLAVARKASRTAHAPDAPQSLRWSSTFALFAIAAVAVAGTVQDSLTAVTSTHLMMIAIGIFGAEFSMAQTRA
jgi:hypothetical protein